MRLRPVVLVLCAFVVFLSGCLIASSGTDGRERRLDAVRADLVSLVDTGAVGAVATLGEDGDDVVVAAGFVDRDEGTAIPDDEPQHVRVGSVTKTFTAAIVLQLVGEGRVALDRSIDTYLPGLIVGDGVDGREISVRQILGHRSGLPEITGRPGENEHTAALEGYTYTPTQEMEIALRDPAQFPPGARFQYTNTNYLVAGMLIEAVTGREYRDELDDRILEPLALRDTYMPRTGETGLRAPYLVGYAADGGEIIDVTAMEPSLPWTSGSLVSTGADLNRFYAALVAGEVLPLEQLRQMLDGVDMGNDDGMSYGLGVGYTELPCGARFVGHTGNVVGFTTITGATSDGRAVTISHTGESAELEIGPALTRALCD
ncbi:serine hydrolase domain-containing protein [Gordonia metallireducens]|uniref:serine hydrolase domain-containing protein n=1 Tax=Gordonia metallireducens TaxID=2897779 RepID=UPI001E51772D|nr:serine hydrolase domain-containing protein [Gordonia metallireducens]